ncbi:hypothetical protein CIB84_016358 [Bambusicola thoracicus]|uniref:Multivesicular body subunit 12A n=1 Tax=Bambusicola thoracicus TaxID=9083 RepID=A0A2P4S705_BAMTH|nr:hypothetical protein CIB84_016358 [Bambusicola thoracicus]
MQGSAGPVVTDIQLLSDRNPQPAGYSRAPEFPEPRSGASRKKRLYVRLQPRGAAETAVFDIKLSGKSRAVPQYMKVGEIGSFAIWCKKGALPQCSPPPVPKPRTVSLGLKQLSLADSEQQYVYIDLIYSYLELGADKIVELSLSETFSFPESLHPLNAALCFRVAPLFLLKSLPLLFPAMDGVPFTLHPKFERSPKSDSSAILADLTVKSLADIEKEYNYTFVVERTAAARLPPSIC